MRYTVQVILWTLGFALSAAAQVPADLELSLLANGFSSPLQVTHAGDDSGRLFVVEQAGVIRVIKNGETLAMPFLNISNQVLSGGELGLLGLAFHPNYASNGLFYVNFTTTVNNAIVSRVCRFQVSTNPDMANHTTETLLFQVTQPANNHNGGHMAFGPDGYLYIGMGDGGGANDTHRNGQDLSSLLGALLRIDVDANNGPGGGYGIPASNPFVGVGGARDEIWAYGLRNPWRFSFDRNSGELWIGDVGQWDREEINLQAVSSNGGENYGWPCREGSIANPNAPSGVTCSEPLAEPVLDYGLPGSQSVTGGYRYRGPIAGLQGAYVFGDYMSGQIWFARPPSWSPLEWQDSGHYIASFGEDEVGHLYLVDHAGAVYRFDSASAADQIMFDGFE